MNEDEIIRDHGDREDALERAQALCNVLNAKYPFFEG